MLELPLKALIESLVGRFVPEVTPEMKLEFLEPLFWMLEDNGAELLTIREQWLASTDDEFVELALMPWSVGIANDRRSAEELLAPLLDRRELQGRIEERLAEVDHL